MKLIDCKQKRGQVKPGKLKGRCSSKKIRYRDRTEAVYALHRAKNDATRSIELTGSTHRTESRAYKCPECSGFHLTSRAAWTEQKAVHSI